ncbi:hypothetical protein BT96DRAFT_835742, partial [Gymnopus androsaceus JB14]
YFPKQEVVAASPHRTLVERSHRLMGENRLLKWLWGFMMRYAVYVWNRTLKKSIGMATPYEKQFGIKLNIANLHIFGSIVYVKHEKEPGKLEPQAQERHWIGLKPKSNGHYIYWPH